MDPISIAALLASLMGGAGALAGGISSLKGNSGQGGCSGGSCGMKGPGFFSGSPGQTQQIPKFNQQQQNVLNQLLGSGSQGLGQFLKQPQAQFPNPSSLDRFNKPYDFGPIREQAMRQFQNETLPMIAERYGGSQGNALTSGSFLQQLNKAGSGFGQSLAALESGINREDIGRQQGLAERLYGLQHGRATLNETNRMGLLQNLLQTGLTPQHETLFQAGQPSTFQSILPGILQSLALYGMSGANGLGGQPSAAPSATPGVGSAANYGLPGQQGMGFANPSLYGQRMSNLFRPF